MRCDRCNTNPAVIQLNMQINEHKQKMHLCQSCYHEIRKQSKFPAGFGGHSSSFDDLFKDMMQGAENSQQAQSQSTGGGGLLDDLGKDLTQAARAGLIDPVIGRDKEVSRVIETLNRRNKNNPVLIGEPGVGKTAIAEGLALKITDGQVPNKLKNKQIYLLDVSSLVAGTGIRGQFEEKMKQLVAELQERKNVIVFIDEIHQIVGAGSAEGSSDAGNILKPSLARGELQIIGATTLSEYRKIEKDAALERRFEPVLVNEPSQEDTLKILNGLKVNYEKYHDVKYSDEALLACVNLSSRYIQDRRLPDKAIDLMDIAGAKINLNSASDDDLEARLERVRAEKTRATKNEEYEKAASLRDEEIELQDQLNQNSDGERAVKSDTVISQAEIEGIVEEMTGIPVSKLQEDEQNKMKHLPERLNAQVIGQEDAVQKVAKAIRRNRAGFRKKNRPIGSFLFVGPTGVGKTELSKTLTEELFGDRDAMIRLDMSEYMEKHSVSKLIGSPPGYVGHEEAGQLTEKVRRKPYSLILLDEIEKAHPDVQHMFLQIMEDGRLTDSQGRTVSFKDTVIIMTSNAGSHVKKVTVGFGGDEQEEKIQTKDVIDGLRDYFRPEFLNRFDGIVPFHQLSRENLIKIVNLMLEEVFEIADEQNIEVTVTEAAKVKLAELGYNPAFGARPLRRVIEEQVEDGIAELLMTTTDLTKVIVDASEDGIVVKKG